MRQSTARRRPTKMEKIIEQLERNAIRNTTTNTSRIKQPTASSIYRCISKQWFTFEIQIFYKFSGVTVHDRLKVDHQVKKKCTESGHLCIAF